jgi:hypothetical protein
MRAEARLARGFQSNGAKASKVSSLANTCNTMCHKKCLVGHTTRLATGHVDTTCLNRVKKATSGPWSQSTIDKVAHAPGHVQVDTLYENGVKQLCVADR